MNKNYALLKEIAKGDQSAFRKLYDINKEIVYNLALKYVQNQQDAEEILQDVFIKIYNNATKFNYQSSVITWIYRITINTSLNYTKKNKRYSSVELDEHGKGLTSYTHPGIILEHKENVQLLFSVIDTLPDQQKTAFILGFIERLPRQDIADILQVSLKATESLLQRAKANLRKKLKKHYPHQRKN